MCFPNNFRLISWFSRRKPLKFIRQAKQIRVPSQHFQVDQVDNLSYTDPWLLQRKPFKLIENLHKLMFTHSPFRLIKLPNNRPLEEQQFFVYSRIILIVFSQNSYNFLSKMSALSKTESEIRRQYMILSLHWLSLGPNCHYDHVLFFRPSLWVLMRYSFDTWKGSFRVC